jgi:hypothetical protein
MLQTRSGCCLSGELNRDSSDQSVAGRLTNWAISHSVWANGVSRSIPARGGSLLPHRPQTGVSAHPPSCTNSTQASFVRTVQEELETNHEFHGALTLRIRGSQNPLRHTHLWRDTDIILEIEPLGRSLWPPHYALVYVVCVKNGPSVMSCWYVLISAFVLIKSSASLVSQFEASGETVGPCSPAEKLFRTCIRLMPILNWRKTHLVLKYAVGSHVVFWFEGLESIPKHTILRHSYININSIMQG